MHIDSHLVVNAAAGTVTVYPGDTEMGSGYELGHAPTAADLRMVARRHFGTGGRSLRLSSELQYRVGSVRYDIVIAS